MTILPIAARELRLLARHSRTYWTRSLNALVVAVISLGMLYAGFGGALSPASAGRSLFIIVSFIAGAYALLDGALMTADCLSREKREGTLGLLFLTDLRAHDIIIGKLISNVGNSAYGLIASLPALGIGLFLGGVTGKEFFCMMLALVNALFFSAAFGMFISAVSYHERRAYTATTLGVVGWAVAWPALGWAWSLYRYTPGIALPFLVASPAGAFWHAIAAGAWRPSLGYTFLETLAMTHCFAWAFLGSASFILPRRIGATAVARDGTTTRVRRVRPSVFQRSKRGFENPMIRTGERLEAGAWGLWPALTIFLIVWALGWAFVQMNWLTWFSYVIAVILMHAVLLLATMLQACRGPREDQQSGMLEILLTTPLGEDVYLRGRMLLTKRRCLWPLLFVVSTDLGLAAAGCWHAGRFSWEWLAWVGALVALAGKLLLDLYTVSWVGFWQGLKSHSAGIALRRTTFYVFVMHWLILLGCLTFLGLCTQGKVFQSGAGGWISGVGYLVLFLMIRLHVCGLAITELRDELRPLTLGLAKEGRWCADGESSARQGQIDESSRIPVPRLRD